MHLRNLLKKYSDNFFGSNAQNTKNDSVYFCPFCKEEVVFTDFGDPVRKNVCCAKCGSLERHRFLYYIYEILFLNNNSKINLLHMAPEKCLYDIFIKNRSINYVAADFEPKNFDFVNCEKQDFTGMSYGDNYFDVLISNQVMEHIVDERKYLSEIRRVMKDNGVAIINIPYNPDLEKTYEDNNIKTEDDRKRKYGQSDHVRLYGNDLLFKFENAGFFCFQY